MDLFILDAKREFSTNDANELLYIVSNKENLLEKKRRWLQLPAYISCGSKLVQRKRPKFLAEKFVPESYIRNDEVSCDNVRTSIDKSFGFFCNNQSKHHVISCFNPSNARTMEGRERILSLTRDLTNSALYSISRIITRSNLKFEKTRLELMKIVRDNLTSYLSDANREPDELSGLSEIFKNPNSYVQNNLPTVTPVTNQLLLSISKTLERLDDELTVQELVVIFRKLKGVNVKRVPQFPPVIKTSWKKQTLMERVQKLCNKYLSSLREGQEIPKELANGLTVIILVLHIRLNRTNVPICEFCTFPQEVMRTQREILHALGSLRKLQKEEIEPLISLIDPTGTVPRSSFRNELRKYMVECLLVCDEIRVPTELLRVVDLINKRPQIVHGLFSEENRDKEVEAVLNVSCYLKSVTANLLPEKENGGSDDAEEVASEGNYDQKNNWCYENNDFEFSGADGFFNLVGERLEKDLEATSSNCISKSVNSSKSNCSSADSCGEIPKKSLEKQDGGSRACSSKTGSEIEISEICDETALVAHKLIGHLIDGFLKSEKTVADELTRSYLTNGSPNINYHRGAKTKSNATKEESNIFFDAVKEVLPSFPKSSLAKVKRLMEL